MTWPCSSCRPTSRSRRPPRRFASTGTRCATPPSRRPRAGKPNCPPVSAASAVRLSSPYLLLSTSLSIPSSPLINLLIFPYLVSPLISPYHSLSLHIVFLLRLFRIVFLNLLCPTPSISPTPSSVLVPVPTIPLCVRPPFPHVRSERRRPTQRVNAATTVLKVAR